MIPKAERKPLRVARLIAQATNSFPQTTVPRCYCHDNTGNVAPILMTTRPENNGENFHISRPDCGRHVMRRFKSAGHAQRFLSAFGIITSHFRVGRHLYKAHRYAN